MAVLHFPGFQHFWSLLKALLDLKAPLESPELTGDPTAPTQEPHDNSTKVATTEYVDSAVAELVNSSPAALDTLKELSDAIGGDANFSTTMTNALALKAPLASPALTGSPTAPTQNAGDNSTKIATTAYADRNDAACVHLAGAETVSGAKTFTGAQTFQAISNFLDSATPFLEFTWPDVTRGTNPSAQKWAGYRFLDKAKTTGVKQRAAACEVGLTVDGETNIALKAYDWTLNSTKMEQIGIAYPKGGTPYTFAPTPAAGDNSTKIATTAFVTTAVANEDATCVHLTGNETIAGTKTFSSTITGSVSGNAGTATKIQTAPSGTSWVNGVKAGGALVSSTSTSYGAVFNAPTKNYRVSLGTYPSSDDLVYLLSITNANVTAGTNTTNKTLTWNAANGTLAATSFSGPLVGNVTGNCSGSSGSCTGNAKTATTLATARDINISDADGTNTGTKISFNGSANGTIKLPATIKASITGNCSGSSGSCTGNAATATKTTATIAVDKTGELVHATMGSNDLFRIAVGGGSNAGWAEIATGDDYNEPIYVRQYQGSFATLKRTATLLDGSGNTSFPGTVTANAFSGPLTGNVTGNCSGSSGSCTGNAKTATTLATARKINGVSFNGSADITVADSTKLPLAGGTMTGNIVLDNAKMIQEKVTSMIRATAPSANVYYWPLQFVDNAGKAAGGMYYEYHTDKQAQTLLMCYRGTTNDNTWNSLGVGYDKNGNWFTYAPTPGNYNNSTNIATTAFVYNNAAKHLAAATNIYVAKAATGNGSGSNTSNYMSLENLRLYLATAHMHSSTADMTSSYTLQLLFKAGDSFGTLDLYASKMPGVRNIIINTSTGTASTTSNYTTNSPTFNSIYVVGSISATIRNVNCTGRIGALYGAYVAIDTYVGLSSLRASGWAYINVAKNMIINVCDAHTDYLFAAADGSVLSMWPGATVTINFRQQCYYTRSLFSAWTNGTILVGYSSFKLTGTKPMMIWAGSGTLTGTSETAAGTAAKVVPLASGQKFTLATNATAKVRFTNDNTAANPTLNINSTGAKALWWNGAAVAANMIAKNMTYDVKYDGTHYVIQNALKRLTNNDFGTFRTAGDYNQTYNSGSWNFDGYTVYYGTGIENYTWRGNHIGNIEQRVASGDHAYPILFTGTADATANTSTIPYFGTGVKINPKTSTIYATTFSGALTGNAKTATTLQTARKINGVSFNGSADITVADSTKVAKTGDTMTGALSLKTNSGNAIRFYDTGATKGTAPSSDRYHYIEFFDNPGKRMGWLGTIYYKNKATRLNLSVRKSNAAGDTAEAAIGVNVDADGTAYGYAPTPAAGSNTMHIATTAWVRTFVGTTWAPTNIAPKYASGTEVDAGGGYTTPTAGVVSAWVTTGWWFEAGEVTVGAYTHRLGVRNGSEQAQFFLPVAKGVYVRNAGGMDGVRFYPV